MGMNLVFDSSESRILVAMSGSRCPRVDPSSAKINAETLTAALDNEAANATSTRLPFGRSLALAA